MGKFYLDNKHLWFRHRAEKAHQKRLAEGGSFCAITQQVDTLRFFCKDTFAPPKNLRISDQGQANVAVIGSNGYIGELDEDSSAIARQFFAENSDFGDFCPAYIVEAEEWSGAYIIRVGLSPRKRSK